MPRVFAAGFVNLYTADIEAGPVDQPPHDTGNGNRSALVRDPDGNLVEIVAKVA